MRNIFRALAIAALLTATSSALIQPLMINFQGKLINPATSQPQNGTFGLTFKIYNAPTGGTAEYTEVQNSVVVTNGVFSVQIGTVTALTRDLFLGASAYLGVTVTNPNDPNGEMSPRQQILMSGFAFTANQLSDTGSVRLISDVTYATFTTAGNFTIPGGITASSGAYSNGITASSGTFTATGATQFSVTTSSGLFLGGGTLQVEGAGGIYSDFGIMAATFVAQAAPTDPPSPQPGMFYYNSSSSTLKIYNPASTGWDWIFPEQVQYVAYTTEGGAATAVKTAVQMVVSPIYLKGPMVVNNMYVRVTTALGAAGDVGIYNSTGGLVLNGGASSVTVAAAFKTVPPVQTGAARFLPPGQYYAAVTWNAATGVIGGTTLPVAAMVPRSGVSSAGGGTTLPATLTFTNITANTFIYYVGFSQ